MKSRGVSSNYDLTNTIFSTYRDTWVDGTQVNPTNTAPNGSWQIVSFNGGGSYFRAIGNGKNQSYSGGQNYGEFLIFTNKALTVAQRQTVENYLAMKWGLTSALAAKGPVTVAAGATVKGAVANVTGAGTWELDLPETRLALDGTFAGSIAGGGEITVADAANMPALDAAYSGAATVKGLAMVWNVPVVPVSTIAGLACNLAGTEDLVCPLMDARRGQVYTGVYGFEGSTIVEYMKDACVTIDPLIEKVNSLGRKITFVGDALAVFRSKIESSVTVPYSFAPIHLAKQRAASVGWLGLQFLAEERTVSAEEFGPTYLRISQAEREREERLEGK